MVSIHNSPQNIYAPPPKKNPTLLYPKIAYFKVKARGKHTLCFSPYLLKRSKFKIGFVENKCLSPPGKILDQQRCACLIRLLPGLFFSACTDFPREKVPCLQL